MSAFVTKGLYDRFARSGRPQARATHFCPGCGHGILTKLLGAAIDALGLRDRAVVIDPVGCAVFDYYYLDCAHISAGHGRAPAVATGLSRCRPDAVPIVIQGDGDLGAIGFNHAFQAANRGEAFATLFVNNTLYGMTGGQMAPTTLDGQVTATTPQGRSADETGYPLHVPELFATLRAPRYVARVSVADVGRIRQARQAIFKALTLQKERRGYAFVEVLAPCPTNFRLTPVEAADHCREAMEREFPLGVFKDETE